MSKPSTHPGIVDGSPGSKVAVQSAARDAKLRNAPLTLVHVIPGEMAGIVIGPSVDARAASTRATSD